MPQLQELLSEIQPRARSLPQWLMVPWGMPLAVWFGSALLVMVCVCLIGYAANANVFGFATANLNAQQILGLLALGSAGGLLLGRGWYRTKSFPAWLPLPAFLLVTACSIAFWQALLEYEDHSFALLEQEIAEDVHSDILHSMQDLTSAVNRMQTRWEIHGGLTRQEWASDAQNHIRDFPALLALSMTNPDGVITQTIPESRTKIAYGFNLNDDPVRGEAFRRARATHQPQTTNLIRLLDGHTGFLYIVPLITERGFDGVMVAVFDAQKMLEQMIPHYLGDHALVIHDSANVMYATVPLETLPDTGWAVSEKLVLGNRPMQFTLYPSPARISERHSVLPQIFLGIGMVIASLIAGLMMAGNRALRKEQQVQKAAIALEMYAGELETARRQAEAASAAKSQFLANMSHEIRTPMHAVLGVARLLQDTSLSDEQKDYLGTIAHSSRHLLMLLNDILDLTKIEAQELLLDSAAYDVRTTFDETVRVLRPLAVSKSIALEWEVAATVPTQIIGDPVRIAQILTNLVGNAIKFTEQGCVRAELHYDAAHGELVGIVADTGIGIASARQAQIFEKFIQGSISISRRYGGSGLGLAITRELVELMGGSIDFESTEGQGSQFWFRIPAVAAGAAGVAETAHPSMPQPSRVPASVAKILIAEDHPVNQLILKKMLKKLGFVQISTALNGHEVCTMLARTAYDAIIMDCRMPMMDGYEATAAIREHEQQKPEEAPVVIIAMTANAMAGDREACLRVGMNDYLSKPLVPEALISVLERYFDLAQGAVLASAAVPAPDADAPIAWERLRLIAESKTEEKEVLELFLINAQEKVDAMAHARRREEAAQWKAAAHFLKGSAANLGMHSLAEICRKAEIAEESGYAERNQLLQGILQELARIRAVAA